jgi:hypothetical protein
MLPRKTEWWILLALALLWLALRIPHLGAQFSFNLDSSVYARGMDDFNVVKDQPHPPGYILWIFGARALRPLAGGPMQAQIVLALLMSLLALVVFFALAREALRDSHAAAMCTLLLAYSPGIALNSSISSSSMVDLASSSVAGYLAFLDPRRSQWRIVACLGALGILAGFRPSGVGLLAPFVAAAALAHARHAWRAVCGGVLLGLLAWLAWAIPLERNAGGWDILYRLLVAHFREVSGRSSIFLGGPVRRYLGMVAENSIYYGMNVGVWLLAFGLLLGWRRKTLAGRWWYALWLAPSLIMVFGIHSGRVGQCLQTFPPLLLICALLGRVRLSATVAGVALSLAISYFPYGRFMSSEHWMAAYIPYRSTPRLALDLEASQRNLDKTLRELQRSGAPQPFVCARDLPDAPNIRTATYDFRYVNWVAPEAAPAGQSIWLFDQHGPPAEVRVRYPEWRRIWGDELISLWQAAP